MTHSLPPALAKDEAPLAASSITGRLGLWSSPSSPPACSWPGS